VPDDVLAEAIRNRTGREPQLVEVVPVTETYQNEVVWSGIVEVFDVPGDPPERYYAWSFLDDEVSGRQRIVTVLHQPPVDSPVAAVRAAIVQQTREEREKDGAARQGDQQDQA
jgi:hypothetical protein